MKNKPFPNIIVVDDCEIMRMSWQRLDEENGIHISTHSNIGTAIMEWIELCNEGHKPRAIVCDWMLGATSIASGVRQCVVDGNEVEYSIDGAAFLIHSCCEIANDNDGCGVFTIYTGNPVQTMSAMSLWDKTISSMVTVFDKDKISSEDLLNHIVNSDNYLSQ